jgi:hypothetical protein
VKLTR